MGTLISRQAILSQETPPFRLVPAIEASQRESVFFEVQDRIVAPYAAHEAARLFNRPDHEPSVGRKSRAWRIRCGFGEGPASRPATVTACRER